MSIGPGPLTPRREETDAVLRELLDSSSFRRSDQLRQLLRYICNEEIEGRGADLSEHAIGVNALGRPESFTPETDSTVRTRTYELRKRLDEYYRSAGASSTLRIELPKGTYRPRFIRLSPAVTEAIETPAVAPARSDSPFVRGLVIGCLATALLGGAAFVIPRLPVWGPPAERNVAALWGPMVKAGSTVTVVVASPAKLWLRDSPQPDPRGDPPLLLPAPENPAFPEFSREVALWGDAAAAVAAARFLAARGVRVELLPERAVLPGALKERNAILLGRPEHSPAIAAAQPAKAFSIRYLPSRREIGIVDEGSGQAFVHERDADVDYGLITVLSRRTFIFSGAGSEGAQAVVDYLVSEPKVAGLAQLMGRWPASFQVVVRTRLPGANGVQTEYAAHKVLAAP